MNDWKVICRVDDIPRLGARKVTRKSGGDIAVFRTADDQVFALLDECPHKGGPLSQGIVFGLSVACPLHNWTIGLADGCAAAPDVGCAQRFPTRVENGIVALDLAEKTLTPALSRERERGKERSASPLEEDEADRSPTPLEEAKTDRSLLPLAGEG